MVHNGIEYGDMQMICEAFHLMSEITKLSPFETGQIFDRWNEGELDSFLVEITGDILKQTDPRTGKPFVEIVMDAAGQKGTGKWTSVNALDMGVPAPTVAEAVFARCLSAVKAERVSASEILNGPSSKPGLEQGAEEMVMAIRDALYCSKICSYAQGFQLMREAQKEYDWKLNFGEIAQIWRGGCIIRAAFLQKITEAYQKDPDLSNLLLDDYFKESIEKYQANWRKVISIAVSYGVPVRPSLPPSTTTTVTGTQDCHKTFCRPKGTTLGHTPTKESTNREANTSTWIGLIPTAPKVTPSLSFRPSDYWEQSR